MIYKSYKLQETLNDSNKFNGIRVNVYHNQEGQYAFITLGKTYGWVLNADKNIPEQRVLNHLFKLSVDIFDEGKEKRHEEYKYSLEFIAGVESVLGTFYPKDERLTAENWQCKYCDSTSVSYEKIDGYTVCNGCGAQWEI